MSRIKEVDRFNAISETGKKYTVVIYQEMTRGADLYNPYDLVPGPKIMETTGSQSVNMIDPYTYQIAETGEVLHKANNQNSKKSGLTAASIIILVSAIGTAFIIAYVLLQIFS